MPDVKSNALSAEFVTRLTGIQGAPPFRVITPANRFATLCLAALTALHCLHTTQAGEVSTKRPNVLYIFTDDQSVRTLGCYSRDAYPWVKTPNIDALAKTGVRFHSVYMAAYCMPARISMLTGNLPHASRGLFQGAELKGAALEKEIQEHPFWPQRLRESGYRTGMIGKWHITSRPPAVGIDWDSAIHWSKNMGGSYYHHPMSFNGALPKDNDGYSVDRYTDLAIDFLKEQPKDPRPWYLWLCYAGVHMPTEPAERHKGTLGSVDDIPEPASMKQRVGKPAYIRDLPERPWSRVQDEIRRYHECVMAIDESVGRLMQTLKATSQLENTVVIFASDQGIAYGQHGLVHKKDAPYDAALRSPLIFSWPGHFAQDQVSEEPVNGPDVVRTLLDIFGLEPLKTMDGMSLLPLLKDPVQRLPREAMLMTNVQNNMGQTIPQGVARTERSIARGAKGEEAMRDWAMIRSGDYKYVAYCGEAREEEIYNLADDPEELANLADSEHRTLIEEMRRQAAKELRATQSGFDGGHYIDFFPLLKQQPN